MMRQDKTDDVSMADQVSRPSVSQTGAPGVPRHREQEQSPPRGAGRLVLRSLWRLVLSCLVLAGVGNGWAAAFQVPVSVNVGAYARVDKPAEVAVNFTALLTAFGETGAFDPNSVRMVEIDLSGQLLNAAVPFQFDPDPAFDAAMNAAGVFIFLVEGTTAPTTARYFHIDFDVVGSGISPAVVPDQVIVTDDVLDEGQNTLQVATQAGTYFYQKQGAGFSSLVDADGNDWIDHHPSGGAAGNFRGIPNLVFPEGHFHPGATSSTTTLIGDGPLKTSLHSITTDGLWEGLWEIYPGYAKLTVLQAAHDYWFLYEGTPGGVLDPASDFVVRSDGTLTPLSDSWTQDLVGDEWVYFADPLVGVGGRSLFLANHTGDSAVDSYFPLDGEMTVFGFGRTGLSSLLNQVPGAFTIGLMDATAFGSAAPTVLSAYKDLSVVLEITPPSIQSVEAFGDPTQVRVDFSTVLDPVTAAAVGNYAISNGVTVSGASRSPDGRTVTLTTSVLSEGLPYTLTVTAVADLFGNVIAPNSQASFAFLANQLQEGLVAYWPLADGTGLMATDVTGTGHDGTLVNGPVWTGDPALVFDGVDDYVDVGPLGLTGTAVTVAARFRTADLANCVARDCRIISQATGTAEQAHDIMLSPIASGGTTRLRFRLKTNGTTTTLVASSGDVPEDAWVHVTAVYDGAAMRLYQDGVEVGSRSKSGSVTDSGAGVWLGGNPPNATGRPWAGQLAEVRIYDRALSAEEVVLLASQSGTPPVTVVVPAVVGEVQAAAQADLVAAGLSVGTVTTANSATVAVGAVISQAPGAGSSVPSGSVVDLVVSLGPGTTVAVPDVVGLGQSAAEAAIVGASLSVGAVSTVTSATVPTGDVISQAPGAGSSIPTGSVVALVVSLGPVGTGSRVIDGQVVLYGFQEGAGLTVGDISGVGVPVDLTITDGTGISWLPGGGLVLNTPTLLTSGGAAMKVSDAVQVSGEIAIEAWVTPANTSQDGPARIVTLSQDTTNRNFTLGQGLFGGQPSDRYDMRLRTTTTTLNGTPSLSTSAGTLTLILTHVVYTRDVFGVGTLYVDGIERASRVDGGDLSNWNSGYALALGGEVSGGRPWLGEYHLVAIFDRALSAAEVQQNFAAGSGVASQPPSIVTQPVAQTASEGQTATFSVTATGTAPLGYQWQRDGLDILSAQGASYATLAVTVADDGAGFRCVVTNAVGTTTSAAAVLTVLPPQPPLIVTQPVAQTVSEGQTATFSVTATGTAPLGYQWQRNGVDIPGGQGASYTTPPVTVADDGATFRCVVSDAVGTTTSAAAVLTVLPPQPPLIVTQPVAQTVSEGQTATFSVTATGTAPLSYQWQRDGGDILGGQGASYTTPSVTVADDGAEFQCVVTNAVGTTTSAAGVLTVTVDVANDAPRIVTGTIAFTKQTIDDGTVDETHFVVAADLDGDSDIDVIATDFVDDTVPWYENGGNGSFIKQTIDANLDGAYPAHVADVDGDGDTDVLAAGYEADTVVWYENDGSGSFTRHNVDTAADGAHSVVTGDMDQDGDIDLLTTNQDASTVTWYENDGSNSFTKHTIDENAIGAKRAEFADIDNDGDFDVVSASFFVDEIAWHENDGNQNFTKRLIDTSANGAYFVSVTDVDGDGNIDVLAASQLDNTIAWYQNDGVGGFIMHTIDTNAAGARTVIAADVDGDGDDDVLAASVNNDTIAWYQNDGNGIFAKQAIDLAADGAYGIFATDMDADGDIDVLSASRDANAVALHLHIKAHVASLDMGDTLVINSNLLQTTDVDDVPAALTYTVTNVPDFGDLRLNGIPLSDGSTFTQADIDNNRISYLHDGLNSSPDIFAFTVADGGENGVEPATGTFTLTIIDPADLLVELPLDEGSGTLAGDVSGMGNNGTLINGPMFELNTPDGSPFAVRFDGSDDFIDLGLLDVNGSGLTLAAWFNADSFPGPSGDPRLISKASGPAANAHVFMLSTIRVGSVMRLRARVRVGGVTTTLIAISGDLASGVWQHAALTYDGMRVRLYLDGLEVGNTPLSGTVDTDPGIPVALGGQSPGTGDRFFDGLLDDIRILQRALSAAEVADIALF